MLDRAPTCPRYCAGDFGILAIGNDTIENFGTIAGGSVYYAKQFNFVDLPKHPLV